MANKSKINLKVTTVKGQAIKPKMGKGTGGLFTSRIISDIKSKNKTTEQTKS